MYVRGKNIRLSFNSPVILTFVFACFIVFLIDRLTGGAASRMIFSVYRSSLFNPLTYIRLFGHVLGHMTWQHLMGNMMLILVIGPMLEEKYGSKNMLCVILVTAAVTGLAHYILFPYIRLLGASGVVFALILLTSFAGFKEGYIPVTFVIVALLYIGEQVYQGVFVYSNVSNLTHIIGGSVGSILGYVMNKNKLSRY